MSLSPLVSFKSLFVTYLLNFPRKLQTDSFTTLNKKNTKLCSSGITVRVKKIETYELSGRRSVCP